MRKQHFPEPPKTCNICPAHTHCSAIFICDKLSRSKFQRRQELAKTIINCPCKECLVISTCHLIKTVNTHRFEPENWMPDSNVFNLDFLWKSCEERQKFGTNLFKEFWNDLK